MIRKNKKYGKPIFNMDVKLLVEPKFYENGVMKMENQILHYAKAIENAKIFLQGKRYVTEKGYILPGYEKGLEAKEALLKVNAICENTTALALFDKNIENYPVIMEVNGIPEHIGIDGFPYFHLYHSDILSGRPYTKKMSSILRGL